MHFDALGALDWCALASTETVEVHVTSHLYDELNKIKDSNPAKWKRERAASILRKLGALAGKPAEAKDGSVSFTLNFEAAHFELCPELDQSTSDARLIALALGFAKKNDSKPLILTDDTGLRLMAFARQSHLDVQAVPRELQLSFKDPQEEEISKLKREVESFKSARPELSVMWSNSSEVRRWAAENIDTDALTRKFVADRKSEIKRMHEPGDYGFALQMAQIASDSEIAAFNREYDDYFAAIPSAAKACFEAKKNTLILAVCVENTGKVPAQDVRLHMHFPDGFTLLKPDELEDFYSDLLPSIPQTEMQRRMSYMSSVLSSGLHVPHYPQIATSSVSIRHTNSYDVELEKDKIQQSQQFEFEPMALVFDKEPFSFEVTFDIRADNLHGTRSGKLHFVHEPASAT